jgi:hypothetical protein
MMSVKKQTGKGGDRRISRTDMQDLRMAWEKLEHASLAARLTAVVGTPIEEGMKLLPRGWYQRIHGVAEQTFQRILGSAVATLDTGRKGSSRNDLHKVLGISTGAVGGFFGLPGVLIELPLTTGIILRSIADIAIAQGEDLDELDSRLACVEVFAFGGPHEDDDAAETGYYSLRMALAFHFSLVSQHLVERGVAHQSLPFMVSLSRNIAARFGIAVSDKLALQMVPLVGAAGGALLNAVFVQHYQDMALGHFTVRRLEREYGIDKVRRAYERLDRSAQPRRTEAVLRAVR